MDTLNGTAVRARTTVRVFLSSTFRDMHAERDYLTRIVFPELRHRCRGRGVEFVALDLRWGVTDEESRARGALAICLEEIEQCRPFFVCLLGDRYGWIPPPEEVPADVYDALADAGTLPNEVSRWYALDVTSVPAVYRLRRATDRPEDPPPELSAFWQRHGLPHAGESITAQEILRAVFQRGYPRSHALFYFRAVRVHRQPDFPRELVSVFAEQDAGPDSKRVKLAALKKRIWAGRRQFIVRRYRATYAGLRLDPALLPQQLAPADRQTVHDGIIRSNEWDRLSPQLNDLVRQRGTVGLDGVERLGAQVLEDLWTAIEAEIGTPKADHDDHAHERDYHEQLIRERTRVFLGRRQEMRRVLDYLRTPDDHRVLVVTGPPGGGKSAFMAACARMWRRLQRERSLSTTVVAHFVGAAPGSTNLLATLRSLCEELRRRANLRDPVPDDPDELRTRLPVFLEAAAARGPVVLFLDALDQIEPDEGVRQLKWLPTDLPRGVKLVVSALGGEAFERLARIVDAGHIVTVPPLKRNHRERLVRSHLALRRKRLSAHQLESLLDEAAHPDAGLPLFLLVALEELVLFGDYEALTDRIRRLPGALPELFSQVLGRLEQDHGAEFVRDVCSWLAVSRSGLRERELLDLLHEAEPDFAPVRWARLRFALGFYLRPVNPDEGVGLLGYYHAEMRRAVFRRYLAMPQPDGEATAEYFAAHRRLAGIFRRAADPASDDTWNGASARALSELPFHLVCGRDLDALAGLFRGAFLGVQAERLGEAWSMTDARRIAELFAAYGAERWDDLLVAAHRYCEFAEAVRGSTALWERLSRRGDVERIETLLRGEPDSGRRGAMALAAATLLEAAGHQVDGERLWAEGLELLPSSEIQKPNGIGRFDIVARRLALALVRRRERFGIDSEERSFRARAEMAAAASFQAPPELRAGRRRGSRRTVPVLDLLLAYLASSPSYYWVVGACAVVLPSAFTIYWAAAVVYDLPVISSSDSVLNARQTLSGLVRWTILAVLMCAGVMFFGGLLLGLGRDFGEWLLHRRQRHNEDLYEQFARGIAGAPPSLRRRILRRALRFKMAAPRLASAGLTSLVRNEWTAVETAGQAAQLMTDASRAGQDIAAAVRAEFAALPPVRQATILAEVLERRALIGDGTEILEAMTQVEERGQNYPLLLVLLDDKVEWAWPVGGHLGTHFLPEPKWGGSEGQLEYILSASQLARALMIALEQERDAPRVSLRHLLRRLSDAVAKWLDAWREPMSAAEPLLLIVLLGPSLVLAPLAVPIWAAVLGGSLLLIYVFTREYDPLLLRLVVRLDEAADAYHEVERVLRSFGSGLTLEADWRLRRVVATHQIVTQGTARVDLFGRRVIRRVLRRLLDTHVLGRPQDVVLSVMGDRTLLAAVAAVRSNRRQRYRVQAEGPTSAKLLQQLVRTIPLMPKARHFWRSLWIDMGLVVLWIGSARYFLAPGHWVVESPAVLFAASAAFVLLSLVLQHAEVGPVLEPASEKLQYRTWVKRLGGRIGEPLAGVLLFVLFFLFEIARFLKSLLARPYGDLGVWRRRAGEASFQSRLLKFLALFGCVVAVGRGLPRLLPTASTWPTNWGVAMLVPIFAAYVAGPEILARWRGAGLILPTRTELWRHRLAIIPLAGGFCVAAMWLLRGLD